MTLYVDNAYIEASVPNGSRTVTSKWCHLMSDLPGAQGTRELIAFAVSIGLRPSWIQKKGTPLEHFDLTTGVRWKAVRAGAVEIGYGHEGAALTQAKRTGAVFDLDAVRRGLAPAGEGREQ